jgi:23S rRNA-/tRNA-specific pseudouridylate synthase
METSGVIVFGKTQSAAQELGRQFRDREVGVIFMIYLCVFGNKQNGLYVMVLVVPFDFLFKYRF